MVDSTNHLDWLRRAEQDMRMLKTLRESGFAGIEDAVCYNCHQAAEKLLKTFLLLKENKLHKTHDLVFLLGQCGRFDNSFNGFEEAMTILSQYAVAARYPSDFAGGRNSREAAEAYDYLEGFYSFILGRLE